MIRKKVIVRALAVVLAILLLLVSACKGREDEIEIDLIGESQFGYTPLFSSPRSIQLGKNYIYFDGKTNGIFKYDLATGEVSEICTDPMCNHYSSDDSCRIANHKNMDFFKAYSDVLIYNSVLRNAADNKLTPHTFVYETDGMKNTLVEDNAASSSEYCLSDKYIYFNNVTVKNGVSFFNHRQISLADGSEIVFGEETEGGTPYSLVGAYGGYLYAQDRSDGMTYICPEDDLGNFKLFWRKPITNIWVGENDLFFRSRDPDNDDGTYYFFQTDFDGNVVNKRELIGDMKWCSFYDGRHLYYIPREETTFINNDEDKTVKNIHWREMYCLDIEIGEREVVFTFDGDYETLALQFSLGNDIIVMDGKIYTYKITQQRGYLDAEKNEYIIGGPTGFSDGIVIIDMENGDVTHITADYTRKGEFSTSTTACAMRLAGEAESEKTSAPVENTDAPEVIVLDKSLMLSDTDALPLFRVKDADSDAPSKFEVFDVNGKKVDLCLCSPSPCTCGNNDRMIIYGNSVFTIRSSGGGKTEFYAYDLSDRSNIKRKSVTVTGIDTDTHSITVRNGMPYYLVRAKDGAAALCVLDMTDAINENVRLLEYPSLVGTGYNIRAVKDFAVYGYFKDGGKVKLIKAEAGGSSYTVLFETDSVNDMEIYVGSDRAVHFLTKEANDESKYGYSLYQYIYREGKPTERILRAKNVCDFAISGEYFYYTVNSPENSRKFLDNDNGKRTYNDMTSGIIFRQSVENTDAPREAVWSVGEYYLYGFTPKNTPELSENEKFSVTSMSTFIQSPDGGIALGANKNIDGQLVHVWLLIGNGEGGVVMTELNGADTWGFYAVSDAGGGGQRPNRDRAYDVNNNGEGE